MPTSSNDMRRLSSLWERPICSVGKSDSDASDAISVDVVSPVAEDISIKSFLSENRKISLHPNMFS